MTTDAPAPLTATERTALREVTGRVHSVETLGTLDGPGLRYVLFLQGCPLRCLYCHNPDALSASGGTERTAGDVVDDIARYRSFIRDGGVTLTGGEPLAQPHFAAAVLKLCRDLGLHTAVDTSGCVAPENAAEAVANADLLLLDFKGWRNETGVAVSGRGVDGSRELLEYRERQGAPVWIRYVLLPGYTMAPEELDALAAYLADFHCVERVDLLPFHQMGAYKWQQLGRPYLLADTPEPDAEEVADARGIFLRHGLPVV